MQLLQKTLKNLKDSLKNCLDKGKMLTKSGAPASTPPTCKYFDIMRFLHDRSANKPTESTVMEINSDTPLTAATSVSETSIEPGLPSTSSDSQNGDTMRKRKMKRKYSEEDNDDKFLKRMSLLDEKVVSSINETKCEAASFCQSLVPVLKGFDKKKLR